MVCCDPCKTIPISRERMITVTQHLKYSPFLARICGLEYYTLCYQGEK